MVDFAALRGAATKFYLNAFNLDERTLEIFDNTSTNADAYRAAEALPLLFAPQRMANGDLYTTGATHDPTGLQAIWLNHRDDLDTVIMLDPMARAIWREPTNIHDAFQLMLMNPIIALQVLISTLYAKTDRLAEKIPEAASQAAEAVLPAVREYRQKILSQHVEMDTLERGHPREDRPGRGHRLRHGLADGKPAGVRG